MGMCASQGRLLSLTSLKSDTELQAQKINNDREALSRNEEKLMTEYTDKVGNKILLVRKQNGEEKEYVNLTASELYGAGYKIKIDGKTYNSVSDIPEKYRKAEGEGEDHNPLQWGIMNGNIKLVKDNKEVNYAADSGIKEDYDTSDDAEAKAVYDLEMKKIQRKDKTLELQLDQIETRHKAYETEIDSVQKTINSNIEKTYNTFNQG